MKETRVFSLFRRVVRARPQSAEHIVEQLRHVSNAAKSPRPRIANTLKSTISGEIRQCVSQIVPEILTWSEGFPHWGLPEQDSASGSWDTSFLKSSRETHLPLR